MGEEQGIKPRLVRYWPALAVLVVIALIVAVGAITSGDDGDAEAEVETGTTAAPGTDGEAGDAIAAWEAADPMDAPDCDPDTGRIMVPSVYAPDCVPLWPDGADNGGATHRGVTADEIVVAVYEEEDATGAGNDEVAARADAIRIAEEIGAFAVIGDPGGTNAFADEMAARGVICFCTDNQPQDQYDEWAPYVWSGTMASTQGYEIIAQYLDERLGDRPAEFAGDPELATRERSFGLIWYETADGAYKQGTDHFLSKVDELDIDLATNISYIFGTGATLEEDAVVIIGRLKEAGVTSVVFGGDPYMPIYLTQQATAQDYYPEWVMTGFSFLDFPAFARQYDPVQWENAFGLSLLLPPVDPDITQREGNLVSWHLGEELTPETFRDGLFSFEPVSGFQTQFAVSYGEGLWPWPDYQAADDVTEIWWDPTLAILGPRTRRCTACTATRTAPAATCRASSTRSRGSCSTRPAPSSCSTNGPRATVLRAIRPFGSRGLTREHCSHIL
ncbi:MAG: hypothetical protein JJE52_04820 [Acidimicrobiia bacterium]|nr:hypothetical protein [Acidimicrobiia bacterium]